MAVEGYKNVYTVAGINQRANEIQTALGENNKELNNLIRVQRKKIEIRIKNLQAKEKAFFEIFKVKNLKELQDKISSAIKDTSFLFGAELDGIITQNFSFNKEKEEEYLKYSKIMDNVVDILKKELKNSNSEIAEPTIKQLNKALNARLNTQFIEGEASSKKKSGGQYNKQRIFELNGNFYLYDDLTAKFIKRIKEVFPEIEHLDSQINIESEQVNIKIIYPLVELNGESNTIIPTKTSLIENKNSKQIEEIKNSLKDINESIIKRIIEIKPLDSESKTTMERIMKEMAVKDPFLFCVGDNRNALIGLFGEIRGIYIFERIFGKEVLGQDWELKWTANDLDKNNKKLHTDIILHAANNVQNFGIQVKNSTRMKNLDISFSPAQIETFLDKTDLNKDIKKEIIKCYGTLFFNVPYEYQGKRYRRLTKEEAKGKSSNIYGDYFTAIERLEKQSRDFEKLLSYSIAFLMHMDSFNKIEGLEEEEYNSNVFYLMGDAVLIAASSILQDFIKSLNNLKLEKIFRVQLISENKKETDEEGTIVEAFNEKKHIDSIKQIKLTSSYVFKN